MPLTIPRTRALATFAAAAKVAPTRTTMDIMKHVLLRAWQGQWQFVATDGSLTITLPLGINVDPRAHDAVLLPTHRTIDILTEANQEDLDLTIGEGECRFSWQSNWFELACPPVADFASKLVAIDAPPNWGIGCRDLKHAFRRTAFCADEQSTRYAMGGVAVEEDAGKLMFVATDSRRLAVESVPFRSIASPRHAPIVIPVRAAKLLADILPETDDELSMAVTVNSFRCTWSDGEVAGLLLDGKFPAWRKVVPQHGAHELTVVAGPLLRALKSIRSTSDAGKCRLQTEPNTLIVLGESADKGTGKVRIPLDTEGGFQALFDSQYLAEFLSRISADQAVTILAHDAEAPLLMSDGVSHRYVAMPLSEVK